MKITRIPQGKFRIGRHVLNKNEVLQYQLEVLKKEKPGNVNVKCLTTGFVNFLREDTSMFTDVFPVESPWRTEIEITWKFRMLMKEIDDRTKFSSSL
jgi:hypothetical protein